MGREMKNLKVESPLLIFFLTFLIAIHGLRNEATSQELQPKREIGLSEAEVENIVRRSHQYVAKYKGFGDATKYRVFD